jgi:peptide deformylase
MKILTTNNKVDEKFLRTKVANFDFSKFSKKEISEIIKTMRLAMLEEKGIGLAANQIGLNIQVFVARVNGKLYSFFNPEIIKSSEEILIEDEGCLSVPKTYGKVERNETVVLSAYAKNNKPVQVKAVGVLARVFQHEVDHLNGILFIDKAKEIRKILYN